MAGHAVDMPVPYLDHLLQRPGPIPPSRLEVLIQARDATLTARQTSSSVQPASDGTISCAADDTTGACTRSTEADPISKTGPIILGIVLPITAALIVLAILHRRNVKKLRKEDAEDRKKSLDFGLGAHVIPEKKRRKGRGKKGQEMSTTEVHGLGRGDRGLSLDLSMATPYLLPPEVHSSRESLHSLSRSMHSGDDRYRPTNFIPDDGSIRSPSSLRQGDDASIYTYSTRRHTDAESTKGLIQNSRRSIHEPLPPMRKPPMAARDNTPSLLVPAAPDAARDSYVSTNSRDGNIAAMRASNNYLGQYISGGPKKQAPQVQQQEITQTQVTVAELDGDDPRAQHNEPTTRTIVAEVSTKRTSIVPAATAGFEFGIPPNTYELPSQEERILPQFDVTPAEDRASEIYEAPGHDVVLVDNAALSPAPNSLTTGEEFKPRGSSLQPNTPRNETGSIYDDLSDYYDENEDVSYDINAYQEALGYDPRLLAMGMRPLPPDDPTENPEERALRIRSFYKEYFEDTAKPGGDKARMSYFDGSENYIDDYYGTQNHMSYGSDAYQHNPYSHAPRGSSATTGRAPPLRHRAMSNGSYLVGNSGPRAHSSASQRLPGQKMRSGPKRRLPPPKPLAPLRNPAAFKDDAMMLNSVDFAPPQTLKSDRPGTPNSLRGSRRQPQAFNPLVSSFDDLSVLPSPHHLRNSGAFSSIDFAPPRFGGTGNNSDAGSIRSNGSGMSAVHLQNLRKGAYRLSRIPKELAGTRNELNDALKPQWNAR